MAPNLRGWTEDVLIGEFQVNIVRTAAVSAFAALALVAAPSAAGAAALQTAGAVTAPATWALMIGGLAIIGAVLRRRRAPATVRIWPSVQ